MSTERLLILGPHLGRHPGWVISQGEILAEHFRREGFAVAEASSWRQPLARALDLGWKVWRERKRTDVAILSVYSGRAFSYADHIGRLCRLCGLPLVMVLHGGALPELFAARPRRAARVLARASRLVAPSPFLARAAGGLGLTAAIIPNVFTPGGVAGAKPGERRRGDGPRLLWMRTLHPVYHPELAIETLAELRRRGLAARLTLAGQDKGLLGACRALAARLGVDGAVELPGFLAADAKWRALAEHDVFLNTNRVDNTPVSLLEAAHAGLPIVATAVGGIPDLFPHRRAALLADAKPNALADAVQELWREKARAMALAEEARAVAAASAWPRVLEAWRRLFAEIAPAR